MACTAETDLQVKEQAPDKQEAQIKTPTRSITEAEQLAKDAFGAILQKHASTNSRNVAEGSLTPIAITSVPSRNSEADTLLYIFNYPEDNGFAVISAAESGEPLLAVIEDGHYEPGMNMPEGFSVFMNTAVKYASLQKENTSIDIGTGFVKRKTEIELRPKSQIGPKVEVRWGETGDEALLCPNKHVGQSIVTLAQYLSAYNKPKHLVFEGQTKPFYIEIDWESLKKHDIKYHDKNYADNGVAPFIQCPASEQDHIVLGHLMAQLGKGVADYSNSNYTKVDGNVILDSICHALATPKGALDWIIYAYYPTKTPIADSRVEEVLSLEKLSEYIKLGIENYITIMMLDGGYTWLADGYMEAEIYKNIYTMDTTPGVFQQWVLQQSLKTGEGGFFHYNWGWHGKCNGYFSKLEMRPAYATAPDYAIDNTPEEDKSLFEDQMIAAIVFSNPQ